MGPSKKYYEHTRGKNLEPEGYHETVASLDWNVGRLVDTLRKRKILDNTLIIVTTEHGMTSRQRPGTGLHGYSSPYDEVSRIPLVMHCPALLPEGKVWEVGGERGGSGTDDHGRRRSRWSPSRPVHASQGA